VPLPVSAPSFDPLHGNVIGDQIKSYFQNIALSHAKSLIIHDDTLPPSERISKTTIMKKGLMAHNLLFCIVSHTAEPAVETGKDCSYFHA